MQIIIMLHDIAEVVSQCFEKKIVCAKISNIHKQWKVSFVKKKSWRLIFMHKDDSKMSDVQCTCCLFIRCCYREIYRHGFSYYTHMLLKYFDSNFDKKKKKLIPCECICMYKKNGTKYFPYWFSPICVGISDTNK